MNCLVLHQRGLFKGEFVITAAQRAFSIGNYIEVVPKDCPYMTGETILNHRDESVPIVAIPLTVTMSCCAAEIEAILPGAPGINMKHWIQCLEVGKVSTIVPMKYQYSKHSWYVPKIDGWVPGMFGKTRTSTRSNCQ